MLTPFTARRSAGFTLIELLVVIAIIAILTAIILPVFGTVQENSRQQSAMASLHEIQTGLAQFKLDNGTYPPVLFGYAVPGATMTTALQVAEQQYAAQEYFPGLYPEYVKDPMAFTDPNNTVTDLSKTTGALTVNVLPCQASDPPANQTFPLSHIQTRTDPSLPCNAGNPDNNIQTNFYLADAYDSSPQITGTNQLGAANVVRYQTSWTDISAQAENQYDNATANPPYSNYNRQLRWTNPPADTFVTATTYHVTNDNRVLVLWLSGAAKSMDASEFQTLAGVTTADSASAQNASFWQVSPTNPANPGP